MTKTKILIVYYSRTGNTKKLAETVAAGVHEVSGVEAILKSTAQVTENDFLEVSGVIAGSPVYFGSMASELKAVFDNFLPLRRKMEGKVGAAFATAGHISGGKETTLLSILQAMLLYGMVVVGDPIVTGGHFGATSVGKPDATSLETARQLGKKVAELARRLKV